MPRYREDEELFEMNMSVQSVGKTIRVPKVLWTSNKDEVLICKIPDGLNKVILHRVGSSVENLETAVRMLMPNKKIVTMIRKENGRKKLIIEIEE